MSNKSKNRNTSLYIHIPFCKSKCSYCDFLSFTMDDRTKEDYVARLIDEIEYVSKENRQIVDTVFIGGGTPTSLTGKQLMGIADAVNLWFDMSEDMEFSMEMNPGTLNSDILDFLRKGPVNRISIGLQSTEDDLLKELSRIHTYGTFLKSYKQVRETGINNVNIDIMFGLPGQSLADWVTTLTKISELNPEHISAYGLIIEEGTLFHKKSLAGELNLPSEETERNMYHCTKKVLESAGYQQYEISNYAKPGKACRHNTGYWSDHEYIGIGLGAASYINGERITNTASFDEYMNNNWKNIRVVTEEADESRRMEEAFYLGLRMNCGVCLEKVKKEFNDPIGRYYDKAVNEFIKEGLMEIEDGYLRLTERGRDVSNAVLSEFII